MLLAYFLATSAAYVSFGLAREGGRLWGDEWRYLWYAENLLRGYFSPPEYEFLWSGPGYPLFLSPMVAAGWSVSLMRSVNGVLLGAAHVVFYLFVRQFTGRKAAGGLTLALTLYLPLFNYVHLLYTESLFVLQELGLLYLLSRYLRQGGIWLLGWAGVMFGWLVLTKVGFWPMLFGGLAVSSGLFLWTRRLAYKRLAAAMAVGVLCCVPFLVHTYSATGRVFYWGAGSGSILYWITNPSDGHYGEHLNAHHVRRIPHIRRDHWPLIKRLGRFDGKFERGHSGRERIARSLYHISSPETDDVLRERGKQNLLEHPAKYLRNVGYNTLRLVFDTPHLVRPFGTDSWRFALTNPLILVGAGWSGLHLWRRKGPAPELAQFIAWLLFLYLGLATLLSCVGRYFMPIAPLALALIALAFGRRLDDWLGGVAVRIRSWRMRDGPSRGSVARAGRAQARPFLRRPVSRSVVVLLTAGTVGCEQSEAPGRREASAAPVPATGRVTLEMTSGGSVAPARVHLWKGGKPYLPTGAGPAFKDNFVVDGQVQLTLPVGSYFYEIERGATFQPQRGGFSVVAEGQSTVAVEVPPLIDMAALGWFAGDLHNHRSAQDTPVLMAAEALHVAPVVTWWNGIMKFDPARATPRPLGSGGLLDLTAGEDERVGGALMYFRMKQPIRLPASLIEGGQYRHYHGDTRCELPTVSSLAREARKEQPRAHVSLEKPFWWDAPTLVALDLVDSFQLAHNHMRRKAPSNREAWGRRCDKKLFPHPVFGNGDCSQYLYYQYLESGFHLPPAAGSASGVHLNPLGYDRVYVHTGTFNGEEWWEGLDAGRSFVTNGPLLLVRANQKLPGHVFQLTSGEALSLTLEVRVVSAEPIASVELVSNGSVIATGQPNREGRVHLAVEPVTDSGWFLLRARTTEKRTFQFASTAPFYVQFEHEPARVSRQAVRFLRGWVKERMSLMKKGGAGSPKLEEMLAPHKQAFSVYDKLLKRATAP